MTPEQFQIAYPQISRWIQQTLATYTTQTRVVASVGFKRLPQYFSHDLLNSAKFVVVDQVPIPPLSAIGLSQFSDFEHGNYDGVTYFDTFFVRQYRISDESLYFHELIHIIQWKMLGPERFIAFYADGLEKFGYRNLPLEAMAYSAEDKFNNQTQIFDAEKYVREELNKTLL